MGAFESREEEVEEKEIGPVSTAIYKHYRDKRKYAIALKVMKRNPGIAELLLEMRNRYPEKSGVQLVEIIADTVFDMATAVNASKHIIMDMVEGKGDLTFVELDLATENIIAVAGTAWILREEQLKEEEKTNVPPLLILKDETGRHVREKVPAILIYDAKPTNVTRELANQMKADNKGRIVGIISDLAKDINTRRLDLVQEKVVNYINQHYLIFWEVQ